MVSVAFATAAWMFRSLTPVIDMQRKGNLGATVAEFLENLPLDIDSDGEGLWAIVPACRRFDFGGDELAEFVRLCVLRLLEAGAVPVRHNDEGVLQWKEQKQYGSGHEEIADAIVAEWLATGGGDPPWEYLWFVTREVLETDLRPTSRRTD